MRNLRAFLFLAVFAVVQGDYLDDNCGSSVYAQSFPTTYYILDASKYNSLCKVLFERSDFGKTKLTISGSSLDSSECNVQVFDSSDSYSVSGTITSDGFFARYFTSDSTGDMYLHVKGDNCDLYDLSFTLAQVCSGFTCDDGQCVPSSDVCDGDDDCPDGSDEDGCFYWSTGVYVGVSIGAVAFLTIVGVAAGLIYRRRRLVVVRSGIYVPQTRYS